MCIPAIPLAIAATVMSTVGTAVGAIGASQQAHAAAAVADQNRKTTLNQAHDSLLNTNLEAQRRYREIAQTQGAQQAAMAANGVDLSFGSALDVQRDTAMIGAEDVGQIYKGGNERTKGYEINAWNYGAEANADRAKASGALVKGVFDTFGTALSGASQVAKMSPKFNKGIG
jgi:hypothetical protein